MGCINNFVLSALVCVSLLPFAYSSGKSSPNKFLGVYPIPSKTPGSIAIDTSKVKQVNLPIFRFSAATSERVTITNTGQSIEASLVEPIAISKISGGPFFDDVCVIYKVRFYWSNNRNESVYTTFDGQSVQLAVVYYFYNKKYGSFKNAINHRDGLGEVNLPVRIGKITNPVFFRFAKVLRRVRKPGSKVGTDIGNTFLWYDVVTPFAKYYTYPGSYTDEKTGRTYYCTTTIAYTMSSTLSISYKQFQRTFGSLKRKNGSRLINVDPPKPSKAPVIQATGTIQIFVPNKKMLPKISP